MAEATELNEKVDHALQVTEEVDLARICSAAPGLFHVPSLSASVERKLAIIQDTCAALYEETSSRRAELLEIAIALLLVREVLLSLLRHKPCNRNRPSRRALIWQEEKSVHQTSGNAGPRAGPA